MLMKSSEFTQVKSNPPIQRRAGFHLRRKISSLKTIYPTQKVDLVEKEKMFFRFSV